MRGSKAKRLRSAALLLTVGQPDREYVQGSPPVYWQHPGALRRVKTRPGVPTKLVKDCTRKTYQKLKRTVKA